MSLSVLTESFLLTTPLSTFTSSNNIPALFSTFSSANISELKRIPIAIASEGRESILILFRYNQFQF